MSNLSLELFDEKSIGRNYQLAALGSIINEIPGSLRQKILDNMTTGLVVLTSDEYRVIADKLAEFLEKVVCTEDKKLPKLYTAGSPKDSKILLDAGIIKENEKSLTCDGIVDALRTLPMEKLSSTLSTPMFLRTYMFSYYRHQTEQQKISVGSLLLATAGAVISMISKITKDDQKIEIYFVPDGSTPSLEHSRKVFNLFYMGRAENIADFQRILRNIAVELGGISLDQAILISILSYASIIKETAAKLSSELDDVAASTAFESFLVVKIDSSGNRPLLISATPATISFILMRLTANKSLGVFKAANDLVAASLNKNLHGEVAETARSCSSRCLSSLYRYIESGDIDPLLECSRDLVTLVDKARRHLEARSIEVAARQLLYHISRMV